MDATTGCLLITHLPVRAELVRQPTLQGRCVIIASEGGGNRQVVDASPAAVRSGVRAGQALTATLSHCRDAVVLSLDRQHMDELDTGFLAGLFDVVDRVEPAGWGRFHIDLRGLAAMYGGEESLALAILAAVEPHWQPRLGLAHGKFPAYCAAVRAAPGGFIKAPADTAAWLSSWSLSWLPVAANQRERLRGFGVATLGEVAALSPASLTDFIGAEGRRLWLLAQGLDDDEVIPAQLPDVLQASLEFPFPVDTVSGIEAGVRELCRQVWNGPARQGRGISGAILEGRLLDDDTWRFQREFREPVHSAGRLATALLGALNAEDTRGRGSGPGQPLVDLSLTASGLTRLVGRQLALSAETRGKRVAPDIPGVHRLVALSPESPLPERRWAIGSELRPVGKTAGSEVVVQGGLPQVVEGKRVEGVVDLWEVDTDWWTLAPVRRRYWQMLLPGGGLATVYRDLMSGDWQRQG